MDASKRPMLYTVLGVLALIGGVFTGFGALGLFALTTLGGPAVLFIILGVLALVTAVLYIVSGLGYMKMKSYMPKLVMALFGLAVLSTILSYVSAPEAFAWTNQIISLAINGAIVWKVNQDKALFKN